MPSSNHIAQITNAMGDPARISMLMALRLDGVLTAGDLAKVANVAPSTASEHLTKMMDAHLVVQQKKGRSRLYTLSGEDVCEILDGVEAMAKRQKQRPETSPDIQEGLLHARLCYDHVAGRLGCSITNALFASDVLTHGHHGLSVTSSGKKWLEKFEIDFDALEDNPRCSLRLCSDWSEGGYHLGGSLAASLLDGFRKWDWVRTTRGNLQVLVTPKGLSEFRRQLGLELRLPVQ